MNVVPQGGARFSFSTRPDAAQLARYFALRETRFRETLGWQSFRGEADEHDQRSGFVLALCENEVVGGVRLYIRRGHAHDVLPLEADGLRLAELFPEWELPGKSYFEAGSLALTATPHPGELLAGLFEQMLALARLEGCRYLFAISPPVQARHYRRVFRQLGERFETLDIEVPDRPLYEKTPMRLSMLDLDQAYRQDSTETHGRPKAWATAG